MVGLRLDLSPLNDAVALVLPPTRCRRPLRPAHSVASAPSLRCSTPQLQLRYGDGTLHKGGYTSNAAAAVTRPSKSSSTRSLCSSSPAPSVGLPRDRIALQVQI